LVLITFFNWHYYEGFTWHLDWGNWDFFKTGKVGHRNLGEKLFGLNFPFQNLGFNPLIWFTVRHQPKFPTRDLLGLFHGNLGWLFQVFTRGSKVGRNNPKREPKGRKILTYWAL